MAHRSHDQSQPITVVTLLDRSLVDEANRDGQPLDAVSVYVFAGHQDSDSDLTSRVIDLETDDLRDADTDEEVLEQADARAELRATARIRIQRTYTTTPEDR